MKYIYSIILIVCLISFTGISQTYWWELKQSGSSLGGPIDVMRYNNDIVYYGSDNKVYKSIDRGESFTQTGTNVPGSSEIKSIILDDYNPGTFLVAIESSPNDKIYKTTDDGQNWVLTLDEGQMSYFGIPMTQDPTHPDTIYTMTNANFKRSTDFGSTWTTIASNFGPSSAPCDIEVFPDTSIILIGDNGTGIYRSLDYGLTWSQVYSTSGEIPTVSVDFTNSGIAWATKWGGGGGFLKSTNYGENWSLMPGFTGINMWGVHVQRTDGNIIMTNSYSTSPGSWRSINGGTTWTPINIPSSGYQVVSVDSMTQFAAQGNGFYKLESDYFNQTVADPSTFTATALDDTTISLEFTPNGNNENVLITWNHTGTFITPSGPPPAVGQPFADGTLIYSGTTSPVTHSGLNDQTVYYYKAFSYNNTDYSSGLEANDTTFASQATFALTVSVDDGWNMVSAPGAHPTNQNVGTWWPNLTGTVFEFNGIQYIPATTAVPGVGYWMENTVGETYNYPSIGIVAHDPIPVTTGWNIIGGYETSPTINALKAANLQISGLVYGFDGIQYIEATNLLPGYGYWVEVTSADPIIIPTTPLSKGSGDVVELFKEDWGRITLTDAEGKSYTLYAVTGEVDLNQYNMPPLPPAGSFDIRFSSGRIAEDINSSMQSIDLTGVTYPLTVRVDGMDIRLQDALGSVVNVNLKSGEDVVIGEATVQKLMVTGEVIPTVYALEQNYPNPFNPSTVIEFSLPKAANISLTIYNTLGQKIDELVNTNLEAGWYNYQWDANNIATGIYIYELRTDKFISVKKMVLMK